MRTTLPALLAMVMVAGSAMILPVAPAMAADEPAAKPAPSNKLKVGDKAPPMQVQHWLQGQPISEYKAGHAYVVEFWATWCGPCIAAMPHMSKLAKQHKDANIHFVGVNVWERYNEDTLATVTKFVKDQGPRLTYNVAYDGEGGAMTESYMKAAGQNGIPAAFIVDREGNIAWIGHPMSLDLPLDMIAKGTWDPIKGPEAIKKANQARDRIFKPARAGDFEGALAAFDAYAKEYPTLAEGMQDTKLQLLLSAGKETEAFAMMRTLGDAAIAENDAEKANYYAWTIVDPDSTIQNRDLALAERLAAKAVEISEGKSPDILDTMARVHFLKGDVAKAIEVQTRAIDLADGRMKAHLEKTLREYKGEPEPDAPAPASGGMPSGK